MINFFKSGSLAHKPGKALIFALLCALPACSRSGAESMAGIWQYTPGKHAHPSSWTSLEWKELTIPFRNLRDLSPDGWITLRKEIPSVIVHKYSGQPLALRTNFLSFDIVEFYLNGRLFFSNGAVAGQTAWGQSIMTTIGALPPGEGKYVIVATLYRGDRLPTFSWYGPQFEIGPANTIFAGHYYAEAISFILLAFYLLTGLYHLLLFSRRLSDWHYLYFGLFCLVICGYWFNRMPSRDLVMAGYPLAQFKTEMSLLILTGPLLICFLCQFFQGRIPSIALAVCALFGVLLGAALFSPDLAFLTRILSVWQIAFIPVALGILSYTIVFAWQKNIEARRILAGILLLVLASFHDIVAARLVPGLPHVTRYFFLIMILNIAVVLADRYARAFNTADRLNVELAQKNTILASQASAFERFVPAPFLELLGRHSVQDVRLGDASLKQMSVLFADIRAFTTLSETMTPEENLRFLNSYLKRMEPLINEHQGFVDKFIGDAIIALFEDRTDHVSADRALAAALDMRKALDVFNEHRRNLNYQALEIGIGINTGQMVLGTVGTENRLSTTVIGDSVNLASRLEAITASCGVGILISAPVVHALRRYRNVAMREIGAIQVKGKRDPVGIVEIYEADPPELKEKKDASSTQLFQGLVQYKIGNFERARENFDAVLQIFPEDGVARLYQRRISEIGSGPVPDNWQGVLEIGQK
ncbi:MAG: hypothetical protein HS115_09045 [Spirochaetales bacterium]|nr:hypothetical protein [Spirochaetales bacterium]